MAIKRSEYQRGALSALNEAKTLALANATLVGVLAGPDEARALLTYFNTILDPLIEKHSQDLGHERNNVESKK
ncbi:hypothetical protein [Candidatus Erwinia dacicola]|uniref:Uncharacterized protein n=1 Tax=Candidatus Erwinia dacicola TaxID=252393 RepID=A0A1E7Z2M9_9GAMM|nr:hypothetical protein [Candidatus Erwinia dacicola]NJC99684.1 hypothetical protein [Candidatus Erwinia dacicola]OFC62868.1 hypothetical protein BBW68_07695 [Candidatus Erwinia dacicola]